LLALLVFACSAPARADQLAWIRLADAERAAKAIRPGSRVVLYCSKCDDQLLDVWQVEGAVVTRTQDPRYFQVAIVGSRLFRSRQRFDSGRYAEPAEYEAEPERERDLIRRQEVDLAYVYVPVKEGLFRCLGKTLGLACEVEVENLRLPASVAGEDRVESSRPSLSEETRGAR